MHSKEFRQAVKCLKRISQLSSFDRLDEVIKDYDTETGQTCLMSYHTFTEPGERLDTIPIQAAIYSAALASFLIDDIMDRDDSKPTFGMDEGRRCNLAGSLLVAGYQLIAESDFPDRIKTRVTSHLSLLLLNASSAQEIEAQFSEGEKENRDPEKNYWKIVHGKSSQQIGNNLKLGVILADKPEWGDLMFEVGACVGDMVQLFDDMSDAVYKVRSPDWETPHKNLLIIFCLNDNNPRHEEFRAHFQNATSDESAHRICRQIMIESGALGYAVYNYYDRYLKAKKLIASIENFDTSKLTNLLRKYIRPFSTLLHDMGIQLPKEIAEDLKLN